ncbi:phosphoprotein associated with glycosphingolipid-enriched microdomains 1 [Bombina bombina]|uniref:phosphoprotein associated with glycosphingolipid-enriched microdomains 1 n=1 Tax=Bombina bombina TaxID=8345 RepID=UPI00235ABADD|nr:phosphoprotein associated with glycosphingolipid-enriched microdomains 1 [Bombina bombina]
MAPLLQDIVGAKSDDLNDERALIFVWGGSAAAATFLFVTILLFLCSSCDRERKPKHQNGDHENLMNAPSDKETFSHSITSLGTEPPASYRNGAVSNGDVSEGSTATCVQPYEDVQSSLPDLCDPQDYTGKSSRCHQSRELPRIPPNSSIDSILSAEGIENDVPHTNEGPYEVLKESSSHENIIEDCLYETVKEIKDIGASVSTEQRTIDYGINHAERKKKEPKVEAVEYASVDHNRKSRQSINTQSAASTPTSQDDDDIPPPLPKKLLDENENVQSKEINGEAGVQEENFECASENDKRQSSLSYRSREEDPCLTEEDISAMYSSVSKTGESLRLQDDFCHYSYIQDVGVDLSPSACNGTYATVRDIDKSPNIIGLPQSVDLINGGQDPEYEAIANISRVEERTISYSNSNQAVFPHGESDYESIGDLQQNGENTKL